MAGVPVGEASYPVFSFEFHDGRILAFRLSIKEDIEVCFITAVDRAQFEFLFSGCETTPSAGQHEPERLANIRLKKKVMIECEGVDSQALADTLIEITLATPMRRLIPGPMDTHLVALIKQLYAARDAYHFQAFLQDIAKAVTESNLDDVTGLLGTISPWTDEDPRNIAETKLMILYEVIDERKMLLIGAVKHLLQLRPEFEAYGGDTVEDVHEIDDLLQRLRGAAH